MNEGTIALIQKLAETIGTTSQYLLTIFTKQVVTDSIIGIVFSSMWLIGALALGRYVLYLIKKSTTDRHNSEEYKMMAAGLSVIAFFMLMISSCELSENIVDYLNPEARAVSIILQKVDN